MLEQKLDRYGHPYMLVLKGHGSIKHLRQYLLEHEQRLAHPIIPEALRSTVMQEVSLREVIIDSASSKDDQRCWSIVQLSATRATALSYLCCLSIVMVSVLLIFRHGNG